MKTFHLPFLHRSMQLQWHRLLLGNSDMAFRGYISAYTLVKIHRKEASTEFWCNNEGGSLLPDTTSRTRQRNTLTSQPATLWSMVVLLPTRTGSVHANVCSESIANKSWWRANEYEYIAGLKFSRSIYLRTPYTSTSPFRHPTSHPYLMNTATATSTLYSGPESLNAILGAKQPL
jgi:hypothetical protein